MADISYHPDDLRASDIDLRQREIRVRSKRGQERIVKIGHQATLSLDRYLRASARNPRPGGNSCGTGCTTASR